MMSDPIQSRVSYIIGFRQASADRLTGLQFVLAWLHRWLPDMEIILVEQDEKPVLNIPLPPHCKKYFIYNPGLYNRCWAFNVGAAKTDKEVLVLADSDMFMSPEDYLRAFEACLEYEAVNPNGNRVVNVTDTDMESLNYRRLENRKLWTFAAGIMLMQRTAFEKINGWDERFEGWGMEDDAISHIIRNVLTNVSLDCEMYHVDHARSTVDGKTQPKYLVNRKLFEEISVLHGEGLKRYLRLRGEVPRGDEDRYAAGKDSPAGGKPKFVLASVFNGTEAELAEFVLNWQETRDQDAEWTLLVSIDGKGLKLEKELSERLAGVTQIFPDHHGKSHIFRFNALLDELSGIPFDLCFYNNGLVRFDKGGWDKAYHQVIQRTGLGHLVFFDARVSRVKPSGKPLVKGDLVSYTDALSLRSDFFTITPAMIAEVGYLDSNIMCRGELEFLDYSLRSFRLGYNVMEHPFDLLGSEGYLHTSERPNPYQNSEYARLTNPTGTDLRKRWRLLKENRTYIPSNDILPFRVSVRVWISELEGEKGEKDMDGAPGVAIRKPLRLEANEISWITGKKEYRKAVSGIKWNGGAGGVLSGLARSCYNLVLGLRLNFLVRWMDRLSTLLIKAGIAFKKIDSK